ncbi:tol-pal system protein YbgF [Aestuariivita boseongensis]|uniref:tol-pal system protein YbgF n=1 Tax=Aestuariivita boseongensis TaxID=1470562 RepID=UPI0006812E23|nr:tol-pal system protein YbgF [Aestuariivita boseongensis]
MKQGLGLVAICVCLALTPIRAVAQDDQTLADIRQELTVLYVEMQRLKRELSTTGAPGVNVAGETVLDRLNAIEGELQRLTARTEELSFRVEQIVQDGTNRIGDLEFRLVELEGGDVSQLGETTTLGGETAEPTIRPQPNTNPTELAVGEEADFRAAQDAMDAGDYAQAVTLLEGFNQTYPGSPLAAEVSYLRGESLNQLGDTREAARAFLESYTTSPDGPVAPQAVFELGTALGKLGKTREACVTLGEVAVRYPTSPAVSSAQAEMTNLGCG